MTSDNAHHHLQNRRAAFDGDATAMTSIPEIERPPIPHALRKLQVQVFHLTHAVESLLHELEDRDSASRTHPTSFATLPKLNRRSHFEPVPQALELCT